MIYKGFIGGAYKGRSIDQNPQTCINLFPEIDTKGGKNIAALYGCPGLKLFADIAVIGEVRGLKYVDGYLYAVVASGLYRVASDGSFSLIATIGTGSGRVWMESNGVQLMLVDGTNGYIYNYSTGQFSLITAEGFPTPSSLTYQDGYFIVSEKDSDRFYISALLDGTSWDATDYATAESQPDKLVCVVSDHRELWLFGERTIEVFYDSGQADFPFTRINGATQEVGCASAHSVVSLDNTLFWLDNVGRCMRASGYSSQVVSTPHIEQQWAQYSTLSDAIAFGYTLEGHSFYQITFPSAGKTWVYDATINEWHERQSFIFRGYPNQGRHRANCYEYACGKHLVGDYLLGKIYEIDMNTYLDYTEPIVRERTAPVISDQNKRVFFKNLKIDFEAGVGLITGQGDNPQAMLQWSDDGGHTWSSEHWASIGATGNYGAVVQWNKLGVARNRVFRVRISDPVKVVMINAYLEMEAEAR